MLALGIGKQQKTDFKKAKRLAASFYEPAVRKVMGPEMTELGSKIGTNSNELIKACQLCISDSKTVGAFALANRSGIDLLKRRLVMFESMHRDETEYETSNQATFDSFRNASEIKDAMRLNAPWAQLYVADSKIADTSCTAF